jgi:hypothetical protein
MYMQAYEACLGATSTGTAPWYVVPADDKENARLIIAQIIADTFKTLDMRYPETDAKRRKELLAIRRQLAGGRPGVGRAWRGSGAYAPVFGRPLILYGSKRSYSRFTTA